MATSILNFMNLSALPRLARSQGCTTLRRLTAAKRRPGHTPHTHATKETITPKQARNNASAFRWWSESTEELSALSLAHSFDVGFGSKPDITLSRREYQLRVISS